MIHVTLRAPTPDDIEAVAADMRPIDRLEAKLVGGLEPKAALEASVNRSQWAYAAIADGQPQCIFGVSTLTDSLLGDDGAPWMLGANSLCRHARALLIVSRPQIVRMRSEYQRLLTIVHADNHQAIRWLKWLGFSMGEVFQFKAAPFRKFEMQGNG